MQAQAGQTPDGEETFISSKPASSALREQVVTKSASEPKFDCHAKPLHLPLHRPGMPCLAIVDIDEGPHFAEPFDDGLIGCLGLSLVVESFDQDGL
jgi:hypothetical protein